MRTKLVLGSLFACAIMIACSSSDSTSGTDDDGDAGNDSNTKKDSGSPSTDKDSGSTKNDASNTGTAKVGDSCTSDAQCSGAVASKCSNDLSTDGSLFPTPFCVGACSGDLTECDGPKTVCDDLGNTGNGICLVRCTASTTAITMPCPAKMGCSLLNADDTGVAVGECTAACKADTDCATGEKCQLETGNCLKGASTGKGVGEACTADDECAASCISPTGKSGYCTRTCTVGGTDCPSGFACNVGISQAEFDGNPTGAVGICFKTCTAVDECAAAADTASWECATLGGGDKACVVPTP